MPFQVTLTHTKPEGWTERPEKGVWIVSIPFFDEPYSDLKEKLQAFRNELKKYKFISDILSMGELNQYNYQVFGYSQDDAALLSHQREKQYLEQYIKFFSDIAQLVTKEKIIKDDILFENCRSYIENLYRDDINFRLMVLATATNRQSLIFDNILKPTKLLKEKEKDYFLSSEPGDIIKLFINYVLNECAIILALRAIGYTSIFYAGKMNVPTQYVAGMSCSNFPIAKDKLATYCATKYKAILIEPQQSAQKQEQELGRISARRDTFFAGNAALVEALTALQKSQEEMKEELKALQRQDTKLFVPIRRKSA
ncbi:MAG: hypothetical protein ACK4PR_09350 [Gammaproteobacteria bacterium]